MQEHEKWLLYAKEDLSLAQVAMLPDYMMIRSALYHAQQSAEKALKAYIIYTRKMMPPRTHDLSGLVKLCASFDDHFYDLEIDAEDINPFSTSTRYPEDAFMYPDVDYAHVIIKKAKKIFDFVDMKIER